jgi:hypothetical protein
MKSLKAFALVVTVVALATSMPAPAGGPNTASNVYTVGGLAVPGVVTDIVLKSGQTVTVTATGAVCPFSSSFCPGPNGYPAWDTTHSSFGGFPVPGAPAWGLIGRVGAGPWVQVGSGPTTLTGSGALAFAVNDDLLSDNAGSFVVTVSYACKPGWGNGDKNHTHCGPPGLDDKSQQPPKGQAKAKGQSDEPPGNSGDAHSVQGNGGDNGNGNDNGKGNGKHDR